MITVTITRTDTIDYTEKQNLLVRETPTDKRKVTTPSSSYNASTVDEPVMEKEYAVTDVAKQKSVERLLLKQEITDDAQFDLKKVISALNGI